MPPLEFQDARLQGILDDQNDSRDGSIHSVRKPGSHSA
jgi:hypothetical protein